MMCQNVSKWLWGRKKVIAAILAAFGCIMALYRFLDNAGRVTTATVIVDTGAVVLYRDANGVLLAKIAVQERALSKNDRVIDSLARALRAQPAAIKAVERYVVRTDTVIRTDIRFVRAGDTVSLYKKDDHLELEATGIGDSLVALRLAHTDTLFRTEIVRRSLFRPPVSEVYLRTASPYNRIASGYAFKAVSPRPIVTIGPYIGYDFVSKQLNVGVGVQVPAITLYK